MSESVVKIVRGIVKIRDSANALITLGQKTMAESVPVVLPSDQVLVAPATFYLVNNKLYSAGMAANMATAGVNNPLFLLRNPMGSGKDLLVQIIQAGCTITNVSSEFRLYSMPTITANGTAVTAIPNFINNAAPAAVGLLTTLPTLSALGGFMSALASGANTSSVIFNSDFTIGIKPGGSLAVTGNPASNNRNAALSIAWAEV